MKKISKKEIRKSIEDALSGVIFKFKAPMPGRKGEKLLDNFSRKYAAEVKKSIKKNVTKSPKVQTTKRKVARKQTKNK